MNFDDKVIMLGKEIYKKVYDFVQANKGDDNKLFKKAMLKLKDGRKKYGKHFIILNIN